MMEFLIAKIKRKTKETEIDCRLNLDGTEITKSQPV